MKVIYDPELQGRKLTDEELKMLENLVPDSTTFSVDDPELTETLVNRMKKNDKKAAPLAAVQ